MEEREGKEEREEGDEDDDFSFTNLLIPNVRFKLVYQSLKNLMRKSTFTLKPLFSCISDFSENSFFIPWANLSLQITKVVSSNSKNEPSFDALAKVTICCSSNTKPLTCGMLLADTSFPLNTFFNIVCALPVRLP